LGLLVSPRANARCLQSGHKAYRPSDCFKDDWFERAANIIQISGSEGICRRVGAIRTAPGRQEALVDAKLSCSSLLETGWVPSSSTGKSHKMPKYSEDTSEELSEINTPDTGPSP
jgi:hypothetical protein